MAELKPAYLFFGADPTKIDAARRRLRERAAADAANGSTLEVLEGPRCRAETVAQALTALSLAAGRRYLLADGVEAWRAGDVKPVVEALRDPPPDTVLVMLGRGKVPAGLAKAVVGAGGEVKEFKQQAPSRLPGWAQRTAAGLGFDLDQDTAEALVARVGASQVRLEREIEKLAVYASSGEAAQEELLAVASQETEARAFELADAVAGGETARVVGLATELRAQGETVPGLVFSLLRHLRTVLAASDGLAAGRSLAQVQSGMRLPPRVAARVVRQARDASGDAIRATICRLADLDDAVKGGGVLADDTALMLALVGGRGGGARSA